MEWDRGDGGRGGKLDDSRLGDGGAGAWATHGTFGFALREHCSTSTFIKHIT